jgi:hypothetical protein
MSTKYADFEPVVYTKDGPTMDRGKVMEEMGTCQPDKGDLECNLPDNNTADTAIKACEAIKLQSEQMEAEIAKQKAELDSTSSIFEGITIGVAAVAAVGFVVATAGTGTVALAAAAAAAGAGAGAGAGLGMSLLHKGGDGAKSSNSSFDFTDMSVMSKAISDVQNISNTFIVQTGLNKLEIKGCDAESLKPLVEMLPSEDKARFLLKVFDKDNKTTVKNISQTITQNITATALLSATAELIRKNTNDITTEAFMQASSKALGAPASTTNNRCNIIDASTKSCDYLRTINCCNQNIKQKQENILQIDACNIDVSDITQTLSAEVISTCGGAVDFKKEDKNSNKLTQKFKMIAESIAASPMAIIGIIAFIVLGVVAYQYFSTRDDGKKDDAQLDHSENPVQAAAGYRTSTQKLWKKYKLMFILAGALFVIHITKKK